jgi:hypothetical protein
LDEQKKKNMMEWGGQAKFLLTTKTGADGRNSWKILEFVSSTSSGFDLVNKHFAVNIWHSGSGNAASH